jgi:glutaredoxin 3
VPDVLMYTKPYCWYCKAAKRLLEERGVAYVEVDLLRYPERTGEMRAKAPAHTVPQIFIDDLAIGGYDDMCALDRQGKLDPLLGIGGHHKQREERQG